MNRRTFVKRGLWGGFLLTAGGALGLDLWPTAMMRRPTRALQVLDARQFAIMAAVAARTVVAPNADPVEIAHRCDERLAISYPEVRHDIGRLLLLLENGLAGLLLDGRARPFTRLSPEAQDAALLDWRDSKLALRRGGYVALRKLTQAMWYAAPPAWPEIGYPGPPTFASPS
ncbi:MAG TPA: hypothetical protein VIA18_03040 [Polyangia bacterium]|jgi:hypothetical protein|nr:hypothetical protein [Polyangia bacterium]